MTGAVVVPYESEDGGKRLAAHLTTDGPAPGSAELRVFLAERLPESHVPSFFHVLDAFPLLASGKADRAALPTPAELAAASRAGFVAPRDAAEELVAGVWAELLGREQVGALDDFFALGGTSLQLTRLAARLRAASGEKISLRGLFGATTVEAQARLLTTVPAAAVESVLRPTPVPALSPSPPASAACGSWTGCIPAAPNGSRPCSCGCPPGSTRPTWPPPSTRWPTGTSRCAPGIPPRAVRCGR